MILVAKGQFEANYSGNLVFGWDYSPRENLDARRTDFALCNGLRVMIFRLSEDKSPLNFKHVIVT